MEKYFNINETGCSVRCKLYARDPSSVGRVVVYGHGFGGHKDNKAAEHFAEHLLKKHKDVAVLCFNAPCHGDDVRKTLLLEDCGLYLGIVTDYAKRRFGTDALYGYATSFGGYLFLKYLSEHGSPFCRLALRCPAVNMYEVLSSRIMAPADVKALGRGKPVSVGFDRKIKVTQRFLDDLQAADITARDFSPFAQDILILHGTADEVVPFEQSEAFAARNGIRFIAVEGADHRFKDSLKMDFATKHILEFFDF